MGCINVLSVGLHYSVDCSHHDVDSLSCSIVSINGMLPLLVILLETLYYLGYKVQSIL